MYSLYGWRWWQSEDYATVSQSMIDNGFFAKLALVFDPQRQAYSVSVCLLPDQAELCHPNCRFGQGFAISAPWPYHISLADRLWQLSFKDRCLVRSMARTLKIHLKKRAKWHLRVQYFSSSSVATLVPRGIANNATLLRLRALGSHAEGGVTISMGF